MLRRLPILATILLLAFNAAAAKGRIIIRSLDAKGVGFDDKTPVEPVGGNPGTTLGQQRLIVFQEAARRWENSLDTRVDIVVGATFAPIGTCTDGSATLGSASARLIHSFAGAPRQNVWYPMALANRLAGVDLNGTQEEISAQFNADVDKPECLASTNSDWYYGLDGNHGQDIDLFVVVLHEIAHGLGFSGVGPEFMLNRPAVFDTHILDATTGLRWDQMSVEQRRASVTNTGNVLWDGQNVRDNITRFLTPTTTLTVTEPSAIARDYDIGLASFGPAARLTALSGKVVIATDAIDATSNSTTDGCSTITNAAQLAGNIAFIDRNNCAFVIKALNAQAAGATGVIISNMPLEGREETCYAPGMSGTTDELRIPVVSVSTNDGAALRAQLANNAQVKTTLRNDPARLAGASSEGFVRLYSPCVTDPGSSTFHWDTVASPNLLMEPSVSSDLAHGLDLTLNQLLDIGWTLPARTGRTILKR